MIKDSQLPEIKTREMIDYLDRFFAHKKPDLRQLAEVSLKHWQQYILSRDNLTSDIEAKDITRFVSQLTKKVDSPRTISNYLGQLVSYFKHAYNSDLAECMRQEKRKFDKEIAVAEKSSVPMRRADVKLLYKHADLPDKIVIRLLLLEKIPIGKFGKINVIHESDGQYHFNDGKQLISIDEETAKIAIPLVEKNKNKRLLKFEKRHLDSRIHDLCKKVGLPNEVKPIDLRIFGKNQHPDDLRELLLDATR